MTKIDKNASKFKKIDYFGKSTQILFTGSHSCILWKWSRLRNGQWMQQGAVKNPKIAKKRPKYELFFMYSKINEKY